MYTEFVRALNYNFTKPPYIAERIDICTDFAKFDLGPNPEILFRLLEGEPTAFVADRAICSRLRRKPKQQVLKAFIVHYIRIGRRQLTKSNWVCTPRGERGNVCR